MSWPRRPQPEEQSMPVDHGPLSELPLARYRPYSRLRLPRTTVRRASAPAVDAHAHLGRWVTGERWAVPDVAEFVDLMDSCNVTAVVNLDGRWDAELEDNLDRYDRSHPGRFATFCHADWDLLRGPDPEQRLADSLERSVSAGAGPRTRVTSGSGNRRTSASPALPRTRRRPGAGTSRPWTCRKESCGRFTPTTRWG
jgi:hypothetical protein